VSTIFPTVFRAPRRASAVGASESAKPSPDNRVDPARPVERQERGLDLAKKSGIPLRRLAPEHPQRGALLEEKPVGRQLGDRTGREADREETPLPGETAQAVDADPTPDRIEDHVRSRSPRRRADRVHPLLGLVGNRGLRAELPADRQLLLRPRNGDRAAPMGQSDLHRGAAGPAGGRMDEHLRLDEYVRGDAGRSMRSDSSPRAAPTRYRTAHRRGSMSRLAPARGRVRQSHRSGYLRRGVGPVRRRSRRPPRRSRRRPRCPA